MQVKFASLSLVLSALFASQSVGAVPSVDCSTVRCAAVECPLGQTAQVQSGACCPTCVTCPIVPCPLPLWSVLACSGGNPRLRNLATAARLASLLRIVLLFSVSPASVWLNLAIAALLAECKR
ncbi:hypothetical protein DFH09DRAFT_1094134 [Mycena vulgaris]|nr:hypothetical protein DFH09DRAFT_1094134 [Mycena vulgaris]